jgi:hypothetical protein
MKSLSRERNNIHFYVDPGREPRLKVSPGERFSLETVRGVEIIERVLKVVILPELTGR